jgi:hypothetical protein
MESTINGVDNEQSRQSARYLSGRCKKHARATRAKGKQREALKSWLPPKPYAERSSVARLRTHMLDHPANRAPSMLRLAMRETHPLNKPWELGPCATLHVGTAHAVSCPTDLTPHFTLTLTRVWNVLFHITLNLYQI